MQSLENYAILYCVCELLYTQNWVGARHTKKLYWISFPHHGVISPSVYAVMDIYLVLSNMNSKIPNVQNCEIVTNQNFGKKNVLDSKETSPKGVSNPKSVKNTHFFKKKRWKNPDSLCKHRKIFPFYGRNLLKILKHM